MKLDYISARGERLPLVGNNLFELTNVDGQTMAATSIASSPISGMDVNVVNNVQTNPRSIVLDLRIKSDVDVEIAKRSILRIIKAKQRGTLEWTQNGKTVVISGIVESVEMPRWNNAVTMQVTLYCEQPYWEDADFIVQQISEAIDLHYFTDGATDMLFFEEEGIALGEYDTTRTKTIYNNGDAAVGLDITIVALDKVTNPIIYDGNGNFFGVGGFSNKTVTLNRGDYITISTHRGKKSVWVNGALYLLQYVKPRSTWLQLNTGENTFTINSDDNSVTNMQFTLSFKQHYI